MPLQLSQQAPLQSLQTLQPEPLGEQKAPTPQQTSPPLPSNNSTYTSFTSIETDSPLLMARDSGIGTGQATITTTNSNSNIVIPRDGGPLSHFLGENNAHHTSTDDEEVIPPVTSYSNYHHRYRRL